MTWDYVVVGAGSAGCVVAARLSEDPAVRVLLLEAGDRDTAREFSVPAAFSQLFRGRHDWGYDTEPEPGCDERSMYWPRGKVLGGSSSINAMIYIRGARADYDGWRDAGCTGWGYDDVLPYFRRSEDNSRGADAFHGTRGPLRVEDQRSASPLVADYLAACDDAGLDRNADFNGAQQDGVGVYQVTQRRGRRESSATAFLRPALGRPNLEVRTFAQATRVVVEGGRAVGVEADLGGRREVFRAAREVVLCGGAIGTPQLLLLSGIGPADELSSLGIPVLVDAPRVGRGCRTTSPSPPSTRRACRSRTSAPTRSWPTSPATCSEGGARSAPTSPRRAGSSAPRPTCRRRICSCCSPRRCSSSTAGSPHQVTGSASAATCSPPRAGGA